MSIEVMTMVFKRYPAGGNERLLALAMADHAHDDGSRVWPSVALLAEKTLQSERSVQRMIKKMLDTGWLQLVRMASGRRGDTNEYRISPVWIAGGVLPVSNLTGDKLSPHGLPEQAKVKAVEAVDNVIHTGDNLGLTGDSQGAWGDTAMSPESSGTIRNRNTPLPPEGGERGFSKFIAKYPKQEDHDKARRRWMRMRPDAALQQVMLNALEVQMQLSRWKAEGGRFVPSPAKWLRDRLWQNVSQSSVPEDWTHSIEGMKAKGAELGMPYSLAALGNCYTDDQRSLHWREYCTDVIERSGLPIAKTYVQMARP